jgi:hypothetical protein
MPLTGSFTTNIQNQILDTLAGNHMIDGPLDGLELGLFTADPGEAGSLTDELSGSGYARTKFSVGNAATISSGVGEINNTLQINFPTASGAWSNIGFAAVFQSKSYTRSIVGETNSLERDTSGNNISNTRMMIPAAHCTAVHAASVTSQTTEQPDQQISAGGTHTVITYDGSDATLYAAEPYSGNSTNFVRMISGPLSGVCFDIVGEGTNTLTLDSHFKHCEENIVGHKMEVRAKLTIAELTGIVHNDTNAYDSTTNLATSGSGFLGGSSSTADRFNIHKSDQTLGIYYCQSAPAFAGDNGIRALGSSASGDAGAVPLPPMELWNHFDQTDDDYCVLTTYQAADWTMTSQHTTGGSHGHVIARLQFEDSSGTATPISVTSGQQLSIAATDLKITLD